MAWKELLSTDIGLLSLFVIVFTLGMGGYYVSYFVKKMHEEQGQRK